ncbi:MAG TPA: carboxypeptidase-like regulatory domain-containing protein [Pyrinomonadaceae bacterium]|nr:carboxypeptidase-like regulatory domain-containing protein [Pyrinomonadaceae bacterium]
MRTSGRQKLTRSVLGLLVVISTTLALGVPSASAKKTSLATVTGAVVDHKGNPISGAVISLLNGADKIVKQARSDAQGRFSARIAPGKYGITAIANGFSSVVFASVEVRASQELIYRFNLEPIGTGKTLPERRKDRDDVRWVLRSSQTKRSIFQAQEGDDADIQAVLGIEPSTNPTEPAIPTEAETEATRDDSARRMRGVVETYFTSDSFTGSYPALNFALAGATNGLDVIVAGQTGAGPNAPERIEASTYFRVGNRHRLGVAAGGVRYGNPTWTFAPDQAARIGQFSVRAIDEWIVHDGIVVVLGLDYSRFIGAGGADSVTPRIGLQFDANARTRLKAAYAPGGSESETQSVVGFENAHVVFADGNKRPVAYVDGRAVMERSHRLEFGVERVVDNESNFEATAFFDTTTGRGVGLLSTPMTAFAGTPGETFTSIANQQGASRGMRLVYTRRLSRVWSASAGYSFGRGQRLASDVSEPADMFESGFFQTGALQLGGGFDTGTTIRTVLRFSPNATVFAIDPFAGRLAVYDPSLSIQVTQELPSFGLPVRAEAVLDARNLLDVQASSDNGETMTQLSTGRRSVRGGISLRF